MSVQKLQLDIEELREASQNAFDRGDFQDAVFFIKKAIDKYHDFQDYEFLANIYLEMGLVNYSNEILFRLYDKTKDKSYLEQVADNLMTDNVTEALRYDDIGVKIANVDMVDFEEMIQAYNEASKNANPFKVVYPVNEEYLENVLNKARELTISRKFAESNKLLESRDFSKLNNYVDLIRLKAVNLINQEDVQGLIDYSYSILNGKCEVYARVYLMFCYIQYGFLGEAKVHLDRALELELDDEIILAMPMMLITTPFIEESLMFADMILDRFSYSVRDICYKSILQYISGDKMLAYKTLNLAKNTFMESPYIYIINKMYNNNILVNTVDEFMEAMDAYVNNCLQDLAKMIVVDIKICVDKILYDDDYNNVFKYILQNNNISNINRLIRILDVIYTEEIGNIIRELILDNSIQDNIKASLIKTIIEYDEDKNISFVVSNLYVEYDFTYPLSHIDENVFVGYYDALLFNFVTSIKPMTDAKIIERKLKLIDKHCTENNIGISVCNSKIISVILCYNKSIFSMENSLAKLLELFEVQENEFYRWYNLIKVALWEHIFSVTAYFL